MPASSWSVKKKSGDEGIKTKLAITTSTQKDKQKREEIGKERVNKTARVKLGRGKREANGK